MGISQITAAGGGRRGRAAAVLAAVLAAALAGGGPATASARPGPAAAQRGGPALGVISTVAGGVGGPARATRVALVAPCGVSFAAGNLYIGANQSVRRVAAGTDRLTTPAGTGAAGPVGNGGAAARASVSHACGTAVDHSGNLVIADSGKNRVRVVAAATGIFYGQAMTAGHIYTIAGTGTAGFSGDGGPATSAEVSFPSGVVVDSSGNVLIADTRNNRVRVVAAATGIFYGRAMTAGHIYTIAGTGTAGFSGDGGPATSAEVSFPSGVVVDSSGNVLIADTRNNRVRVAAAATGTFYGQAMTVGDIYTVAGGGTGGLGDGGPAAKATLGNPAGVAVDSSGNLLIADANHNRVRVAAASTGTFYGRAMTAGDIYTIAGTGTAGFSGDGGPATSAELSAPASAAVDSSGNLLIADTGNHRVRVAAASTGTFYGQAMTAGHIYTVAGNGSQEFSGGGGLATSAQLYDPHGVTVDGGGNLVISDFFNNRIRVVAASTGTLYGRAMTAGDIYTIAGTGAGGFSGDGGPASSAKLSFPSGVAVDSSGNVLIADSGNHRVRVVAASTGTFYGRAMTAGDIYTIAGTGTAGFSGDGGPAAKAELDYPAGVAVDSSGNVLIADSGNERVRVVAASTGTFYGQAMTAGDIYTVAAGLSFPSGVAVDSSGNALIADTNSHRIRVVAAATGTFYGQAMTVGHIYTIAGTGTFGFSGDGGPATSAELRFPSGVAVDSSGNVLIADTANNRVRVVAASTGTFYGQAMTAGDIYTGAGNGKGGVSGGFSGDGGPATGAELSAPIGVAVDAAANLLIADSRNNRVRSVAG